MRYSLPVLPFGAAALLLLMASCAQEPGQGNCPAGLVWDGTECVRDRGVGQPPGRDGGDRPGQDDVRDGTDDLDDARDNSSGSDAPRTSGSPDTSGSPSSGGTSAGTDGSGDPGGSGPPGGSGDPGGSGGPIGPSDPPPTTPGPSTPGPGPGSSGTPPIPEPTPPPLYEDCNDPGETPTTLRGTVTIPSGALPLPDVAVYVPIDGTLRDIDIGASCQPCGDELSGRPRVWTTTDIQGRFELRGVPAGEPITLVTEVGKWRRVSTIPAVQRCTVVDVDSDLTRLPRNQQEGSLPQFAVTTGGCDAMECLLRKIGISDSEFTPEGQGGRVNLFHGQHGTRRYANSLNNGANFTSASSWWRDLNNLLPYDIIIHSCECSEQRSGKPDEATRAMRDFTNVGGRLFLSHYHYVWMRRGPADFQSVAQWSNFEAAIISNRATIDTSFGKGQQLANWMHENGISTSFGSFAIRDVRASVRSLNDTIAQRWAWINPTCLFPIGCPSTNEQPQYMSFNTPIGTPPEQQCGRVVHSDIHVSGGDRSSDGTRENSGDEVRFPDGCRTSGLTEQESVLVFMLFDLSRCIVPDKI